MRMIERWFPCQEVSQAAEGGWGSGKSEKALFTWFAARPLAQAKAAVITSLLPWPDDPIEQERLQGLVRGALLARDGMHSELRKELERHYPTGTSMLDPFSGRAMIPLEAARLSVKAWGFDYSPVATLAGTLLADYPLRDFSAEPPLPFGESGQQASNESGNRLPEDVRSVLAEIGRRYAVEMASFYPRHQGKQPWGYLWAVTLPCQECKRRFPITGSLVLRHPLAKKANKAADPGQSYRIEVDKTAGTFRVVIHDGKPTGSPTLVTMKRAGKDVKGKVAICPFCEHVHLKDVHTRLAAEGQGRDAVLLAADIDDKVGKHFRRLTDEEQAAVHLAEAALTKEQPFGLGLPAVPNEPIPAGNNHTVRPSMYGARSYGDLCNARQTLGFVRLCRIIARLGEELKRHGLSDAYATALCGYAASVVVRKLKYSTRGVTLFSRKGLSSNRIYVAPIFRDEASIGFSYDFFETALGDDGSGTWACLASDTLSVLRNQASRNTGRPALIRRGSALSLPLKAASVDAVITDPPYDNMIDYSDASDLFYVWLKRALSTTHPDFGITADPCGVQEKTEEIIVKGGSTAVADHRTKDHYDTSIARAFAEAQRVVRPAGVVTIVFGHGDPDVWRRLLKAITQARLFLTGSWPAKTETGGKSGSANIVTTLTLCCRPVPTGRRAGRDTEVRARVRAEVRGRMDMWTAAGLALTDQLMASAGPAMEVVGQYESILDKTGTPVDPYQYLVLARKAVEEAAAIRIDTQPLESFDGRTRFALFWVRLYGRNLAPKSEARWQALASDLTAQDRQGLLQEEESGARLVRASEVRPSIAPTSAVIDVALALCRAWQEGLGAVAEALEQSGRTTEDPLLWAALTYLSARLPEGDPDQRCFNQLVRSRGAIATATRTARGQKQAEEQAQDLAAHQMALIESESGGASAATRRTPRSRTTEKAKKINEAAAQVHQGDLFQGDKSEGK